MTEIQTEDHAEVIAAKIYYDFAVLQSCKIFGWQRVGDEMLSKGEEVWKALDALDKKENFTEGGQRRRRRVANSVGGFLAHKIFKFARVKNEGHLVYTIWRIQ